MSQQDEHRSLVDHSVASEEQPNLELPSVHMYGASAAHASTEHCASEHAAQSLDSTDAAALVSTASLTAVSSAHADVSQHASHSSGELGQSVASEEQPHLALPDVHR